MIDLCVAGIWLVAVIDLAVVIHNCLRRVSMIDLCVAGIWLVAVIELAVVIHGSK